MIKKFLISVLVLAVFIWAVFGAEIDITAPEDTTAGDNTPDLNVTFNESVNVSYSWDSEGNISGCRECDSYNTTYGENNGSDAKLNLLFHFNENFSNATYDDASYDNDGTLGNATDGTQPAWTSGRFGHALEFDGSDDFVNVTDDPTIKISQNITIAAWVKPKGSGSWRTILRKGQNGVMNYKLQITSNSLEFSVDTVEYNTKSVTSSPITIENGVWTHVVGTYDNTTLKVYINGTESGSAQVNGSLKDTGSQDLTIGRDIDQNTWFNGTIDEVAIYNRSFSGAEILELYNKTLSDGSHCVTVYANDSAGSLNSTEKCFTVGTAIPTITVDSPTNTTITDNTPDLNFTIDETANVTYNWDGEGNISGCRNCSSFNTTYGEYANTSELNLTLLLHFNENFGNTAYDDSSNNNDGTLVGGATWAPGKFGYGVKLDGSTGGINVSYDSSLDIIDNNNQFALGVWFKLDRDASDAGANNVILSQQDGGGDGRTWLQVRGTDDKLASFLGFAGLTGNTVVVNNTWYFVVLTFDGTDNLSMYVNGNFDASKTDAGIDENANGKYLFGRSKSETIHFNGTIDEVMFFNRSLSAAEIQELYNGSLSEGQHSVAVYATDTVGNSNSTTRWFTVDVTPPAIDDATHNINETIVGGGVYVNLSVEVTDSVAIDTVIFNISDTNYTTNSVSGTNFYEVQFSTPGTYCWDQTWVNDTIGNTDINTSVGLCWEVDVLAPTVSAPEINGTVGTINYDVRINATISDAEGNLDSYILQVDRPTSSDYNVSMVLASGNEYEQNVTIDEAGTWNFKVFANDTAGNGTWSSQVQTDASSTPESTINIIAPLNTTISENQPDLNFTINETANVTYSWDSEGNISGCRNCTSFNTTYGENSGSDTKLNLLFHFNENFSNTTFDDSGSSNDGTRGNVTGGTQPNWTKGKFGPALEFDSVNDFVNVSDSPSLDFTENLTMTAWVYPRFTLWPGYTGVASKDATYALGMLSGKLRLSLHNGTQWSNTDSPDNVPLDQWVHIAGTFNGTWTWLYINGVEVKSQAVLTGWGSSITTTSYPLQVGYFTGQTYFNGTIDEVAIYNRTLSAAEIWQMYKKSLSNGPHCVTVYANDSAGDLNSTEKCFTVITTITIDSPANDTINGTIPDLNFTISNTANVNYSWDSGGNISGCRNCDSYNTTYGENDGSDANLVALYHFNENFSDTAYDDSDYGNDGDITGATWTTGKFGHALEFNGSSDFVEVPDSDSLDISGNISVSAWINFADVDERVVLIKDDEYLLKVESGANKNKISFYLYNTSGWEPRATTPAAKSPNTWHHVVGTWDQSTEAQRLYVDGILEDELTHTLTPTPTTNPLTIGRWTGSASWFNGTIDEVAIYNRTLSAAEVLQMYVKSLPNGPHCVTVYANNSAGSLNSTERCFTVSAPVPAKILAGTNRFSVWAPYSSVSGYETDNLSSTFIAGALVMDPNGEPISGEYVSFMSYSGDSTLKAAIINTTNANGIAYARYRTFGDFTGTGTTATDPDYGNWTVVAMVTDDTSVNATRYLKIDADGYNAGSCSNELCHNNPSTANSNSETSPKSPYSDKFGLSGTYTTMASGGHLGWSSHANNGCEFCHSGYGKGSGAPATSYPWGAHTNIACTYSGCHGGSVFSTFPPNMPSCYDCHSDNGNNTNLSTVNTTTTVNSIAGATVYSWNHELGAPLMAHTTNKTYNMSRGIPCWICHGPMHNITKPDPAAANTNSYTESSQCTTCHSPKTEHNNQVKCTVCHSQDAHNISFFNGTGNYIKNSSNAGDCTTCHQQTTAWNTLLTQPKAGNYSGSGPPQVPVPLNHSDNTTGQRWGDYWEEGNDLAACNYCHGDTKHNATALGRLASWSGANTVNSSINATNSWCAGCHYQNYTSGSDSYTGMTSKFTGDNLSVPPEITNNSDYAPDETSGYFLHSFTSAPFYNDSQCEGCHGSLAPDATNMTALVHNVATGKGCTGCHFSYAYMSGQSKPTKFLNETLFTTSVHGNESVITCENCHTNTTGHPGSSTPPQSGWKWCEDCHVVNQSISKRSRHNLTRNPQSNWYNATYTAVNATNCRWCHNATTYNKAVETYNKTQPKNCRDCHAFPDLLPGGD